MHKIVNIRVNPWDFISNDKIELVMSIPIKSASASIEGRCKLDYLNLNSGTMAYKIIIFRGDSIKIEFVLDSSKNPKFYPEQENIFTKPTENIMNLAKRIINSHNNMYDNLYKVYEFIIEELSYIFPPIYYGPEETLKRMSGDCLCYSQVFSSACNILKLPNRTVFGWLSNSDLDTPHVWNEVFIGGEVLSIDTCLAQNIEHFSDVLGIPLSRKEYFGNTTNSHTILSYGHMHHIEPELPLKKLDDFTNIITPLGKLAYGEELLSSSIPWLQGVYLLGPNFIDSEDLFPFNVEILQQG